MTVRLIFTVAALSLLTACGNATDAVTFQAPPSYHSKASFGPFMQLWEGAPNTVIMLMSLPVQTDLDKAMDQANLKDAKVRKREHIKICDGQQDAIFADVEGETVTAGTKNSSGPSEIEFLATDIKGKTYMTMYARPLHSAADPAAEAAVRNVCPK